MSVERNAQGKLHSTRENAQADKMISSKKILVILATFAFTSATTNTEPSCGNVRPGRYCNKDLSGFKICGETGEVRRVGCHAHYMCPCGFNSRCQGHTRCVERPVFKPNQIPADFSVSFTGERAYIFHMTTNTNI